MGKRSLKQLVAAVSVVAASAPSLHALETRDDNPDAQNRFSSGFSSNPVDNTSNNFLLSGYNLSGIGWDPTDTRKGFVMISPIHFLAATHFAPNSSDSITFQNQSGNLVNIGVAGAQAMKNNNNSASDLTLGTLDRALVTADQVNFFSVADLATESLYTGRALFVYGSTPKVGQATIGAFQDFAGDPVTAGSGLNPSRTYQFTYADVGGGGNDAYFEVGDSGSPSFTIIGGQLAITGTHSALVSGTGVKVNYDTFVPDYFDELNTAMAIDGFQVTAPATVPEPSAYALLLGSIMLAGAIFRRRSH